jgi:AraC-like DNA-binding protein
MLGAPNCTNPRVARLDHVSYRELPAPALLHELAECVWISDAPRRARVLPDGCMDLIEMDDRVLVAGPDTTAFISEHESAVARGIRFRPGVLPRLLGIPAIELRNNRIDLELLHPNAVGSSLTSITARLLEGETARETAPWRLGVLRHVTGRLGSGAAVHSVADEIGWSARNLQRQCAAVYGYGPATLRRILRFRKAVRLLDAGMPAADTAAMTGYADQSHLSRQVHELAGVPAGQLTPSTGRDFTNFPAP